MTRSHYDTIGAPEDASASDLRRAYLRRARQLHPDQFANAAPGERSTAERRMQVLNAAWTVLSDPEARRAYDAGRGHAGTQGTGPIVSARNEAWRPFDGSDQPPVRAPEPKPVVVDDSAMEIRGVAKLVRPAPLLAIFAVIALTVVLLSLVGGGGSANTQPDARPAPTARTGEPLGCVNLFPAAEEVPCGDHDGVVWSVVSAGEPCPDDLEAAYRQGQGGLFCITRVG